MAKIAITGTGSLIGQAIIKSIKKSSFGNSKLIGIDYFKNTVGSYWTDKHYILPDILNINVKKEYWVKKVIDIINLEKINILFTGIDFELPIFAKYKNLIKAKTNCLIVVSNLDVIKICHDKYLTFKFLKENSFAHPKTFLKNDIERALKKLSFPIVIKPRSGSRSTDVLLVNTEKELRKKIKYINNPIIQECIGDKNAEYTCSTIFFDGKVKKSIALRRDIKDGHTSTTYFDDNIPSSISTYIEKVSTALKGQFGVCNFQLRIDYDGVPKIFEINPRHSGTTFIRSLYGYNEIEYILEYLLNFKETKFSLRYGIVKRYFDEFFIR